MPRPLPEILSNTLDQSGTGASLYFDRGFDRFAADGRLPDGSKQAFLTAFAASFKPRKGHYDEVLARRVETLRARGARQLNLFAHSRLAVGLGLPSPIEVGFLLDRRTGSPYLPGSSVKGLARATAQLVHESELASEARDFWGTHHRRVFGPASGDGIPARGEVEFFDAFPASWPDLEVDILTPHHQGYYAGIDAVAADWDEPVPVPFLTVAPRTEFLFWVRGNEEDVGQVEAVLSLGLEWLGIGGKKSAGYGVFGLQPPRGLEPSQAARPTASAAYSSRPQFVALTDEKAAPPTKRRPTKAEFQVSDFDQKLERIRSLGSNIAGQAGPHLEWFATLQSPEPRRAAAECLVNALGLKSVKRKAKEGSEPWAAVLAEYLASHE
jgi:CRISPR type III-B/RAMP module RAMP protein Cmr6